MTHTPGPWRLDGDAHSMNLDVVSSEGRIAMMDCDNFELPDSELAANANLIAAAPDLLAVVCEMLGAAETDCLDETSNVWRSVMMDARAAIAKAKGN